MNSQKKISIATLTFSILILIMFVLFFIFKDKNTQFINIVGGVCSIGLLITGIVQLSNPKPPAIKGLCIANGVCSILVFLGITIIAVIIISIQIIMKDDIHKTYEEKVMAEAAKIAGKNDENSDQTFAW